MKRKSINGIDPEMTHLKELVRALNSYYNYVSHDPKGKMRENQKAFEQIMKKVFKNLMKTKTHSSKILNKFQVQET